MKSAPTSGPAPVTVSSVGPLLCRICIVRIRAPPPSDELAVEEAVRAERLPPTDLHREPGRRTS